MRAKRKSEEQAPVSRAESRRGGGYAVYDDYGERDDRQQPRYVISVAAQILGVHPQTLRMYEREGLVEPRRTGGKIRLYSEHDIERVRCVMRLTNDLGVNLAGAEAILNMRERMLAMHRELEQVRRQMEAELDELRRELDVEA